MVVAMGHSSALGLAVSAAAVTAALSSPDSRSRASVNAVRGGHGLRAAARKATRGENFEPLLKAVAARRRESPFRGGMSVRVQASSSDESSSEKGQVKTENVPGWAEPNSEELPPWAKNERPASQEPAQEVPFPLYLLGSTLVAIAAVGSVFEYFNKNAIFGIIPPDSPLYTPILGLFAITGLPTAGFLFYKSIQLANKASEEADKEDGFRR